MNMNTLSSRLQDVLKRGSTVNNQNRQYPQLVSSSTVSTMIPTPGISHNANSNMMVGSLVDTPMISTSVCNSIVPNPINPGSLLSTGGIHGSKFPFSLMIPVLYDSTIRIT